MDTVTIAASNELAEMKLNDLIGRKGSVVKALYSKDGHTIRGAWIKLLGEPYLNEEEWFIPCESITW